MPESWYRSHSRSFNLLTSLSTWPSAPTDVHWTASSDKFRKCLVERTLRLWRSAKWMGIPVLLPKEKSSRSLSLHISILHVAHLHAYWTSLIPSCPVHEPLAFMSVLSNDPPSLMQVEWWRKLQVTPLCVCFWLPLTTVNKRLFSSNYILRELCNFKQYTSLLKWLVHYTYCHSQNASSVILNHSF